MVSNPNTESCDGADNDCDGQIDEGFASPFHQNQWWRADYCALPALQGSGYQVGDVAYDQQFLDQNGDSVSIYQFYGKIIVVELAAQWCNPCATSAPDLEALWLSGGGDIIVLTA